MSDEEKKALERIDYIQDFIIENGQYDADVNDMQYFSKVLNIIEKQFKEIEELKNADLTTVYLNGFYDGEKKVQDKIKAKIKELEKLNDESTGIGYWFAIYYLQSLLEKE